MRALQKMTRDQIASYVSGTDAKAIQVLQDFDKFENLEVLFLNDNNLVTIVGLEKNFRLRRLYLMVRQHRHSTHTKLCTHISRFGRHRS